MVKVRKIKKKWANMVGFGVYLACCRLHESVSIKLRKNYKSLKSLVSRRYFNYTPVASCIKLIRTIVPVTFSVLQLSHIKAYPYINNKKRKRNNNNNNIFQVLRNKYINYAPVAKVARVDNVPVCCF
jgi:hypothetical protein